MIPYFYIIEHIKSGKRYAGAKWAKNSNPDTFLKENGYKTSSKIIKNIIQNEGITAFSIVDIITEDELKIPFGWANVFEYESWFLSVNECHTSENWFNRALNVNKLSCKAWNKGLTKETNSSLKSTSEKLSKIKLGSTPWNKGLTKDIDERVNLYSEKSSKTRKENNSYNCWCKGQTKETNIKLAESGAKQSKTKKEKGYVPWNKGKSGIYSEEAILKMSEAGKKRNTPNPMLDEENRKKVSQSKIGRKRVYSEDGKFKYIKPENLG